MVKISVIIPAYQAAAFIEKTLNAIAQQTLLPAEVLVIDDGSSDNTCAIIEKFSSRHPELNMRLIKGTHKGPGAARNIGVSVATSDWVAFLDSDDLWHVNKIELVSDKINQYPGSNFFCNNEMIEYPDGKTVVVDYSRLYSPEIPLPQQLYKHNLFSTSAVVCRRADVLNVNGFDEELSSAQDYELWLRMSPAIIPVFIKEVLGTYVVRDGNISTTRHFRRLVNIWRVMIRHRTKGTGIFTLLVMLFRLTLAHIAGFVLGKIKKITK